MPNLSHDGRETFKQSALDYYWCFKLVNADTKSQCIFDTVEFRHKYLAIPAPISEDRIIQGLQQVAGALAGTTPPTSISQVDAIAIFEISLNHGVSWHPPISGHLRARPSNFEGCTATLPQEVRSLCLLRRPPLVFLLLLQPGQPNRPVPYPSKVRYTPATMEAQTPR